MIDERLEEFDADCSRKRSLDRRRETSRYAARDRRGKEADIFTDLKDVVPIVDEATVTHVDRIALLRVASTMFRLRKHASKLLKTSLCDESLGLYTEATLLESLDGFIAIIDADGVILYVTESVSIYLGLTQTDLTGRSLKEFVHPHDYEEFSKSGGGESAEDGYMTVLRMKSVISPRGRNLNLKSALFKPVNCRLRAVTDEGGRLRVLQCSAQPAGQGSSAAAAAKNAEVPNGTYMTRHTCDMKFSYVSESFNYILRHEARSLMGTSFYNLVHPADIGQVATSMREMLVKGHTRTPYYRLIGAGKTVVWVQTEATTVNHTSKGHKGQYVICVHELLGTQSELDSFTVEHDSRPLSSEFVTEIKKEIDDSPDSRKGSYEEVLQWLFRDHPNSPAPTAAPLFRSQEHLHSKRHPVTGPCSIDPDPPLATAALYATRIDSSPQSSLDDVNYDSNVTSASSSTACTAYNAHGRVVYSPMAAGVAECELRSSVESGGSGAIRGGGGVAGSRTLTARRADSLDCLPHGHHTLNDFTADLPSDPFLDTVRISALPSADAYSLSASDVIGGGNRSAERCPLYTALSATRAQYPRAMTYDPYMNAVTEPTTHSTASHQATPITLQYKDTSDGLASEFFESPDLQMLAPFVAQEDMMQLTTDIHGLLPDFNFPDWIPADPAPLSNETEQRICQTTAESSPLSPAAPTPMRAPQTPLSGRTPTTTLPTTRKATTSVPNQRSFRPVPYPAASTASKSNTAHYSFNKNGVTVGSLLKRGLSLQVDSVPRRSSTDHPHQPQHQSSPGANNNQNNQNNNNHPRAASVGISTMGSTASDWINLQPHSQGHRALNGATCTWSDQDTMGAGLLRRDIRAAQ